jgi:hypothetical protein
VIRENPAGAVVVRAWPGHRMLYYYLLTTAGEKKKKEEENTRTGWDSKRLGDKAL